jgi:hypothetical protein
MENYRFGCTKTHGSPHSRTTREHRQDAKANENNGAEQRNAAEDRIRYHNKNPNNAAAAQQNEYQRNHKPSHGRPFNLR